MSIKPTYEELEQRVNQLKEELSSFKKDKKQDFLETFFPDFLAELPVMAHSIDKNMSIVSVSNVWLQKLGYSREEVIGKKATDFLTEESKTAILNRHLPEFFDKGFVENLPVNFLTKSRSKLPVLLSSIAFYDSGDDFHRSLTMMTDISEMVQAEQLLLSSEERFRTLTSLSPGGIFQTDRKGDYIYTNEAWRQMTDLGEEEALGKGWIAALYPEDRVNVSNEWYACVAQAKRWEKQFRCVTADGKPIWIYGQAVPKYDSEGNVVGYMGLNIDVTAQKESEEEQQKIKRSYENAQRLAKVGNWEIDLQTGIITWSEEIYRVFGIESGEETLTYDILLDKVHEDDRSYHDSIFNLLKTDGSADFEYRLVRPDGEIRCVMGQGETVYTKNAVPKRMYGTLQDITEQKEIAKSLEDSNTDLRLAQHIAAIGNWHLDPQIGVPVWSDEVYRIYERDPNNGPIPFEDYQKRHPGKCWERFHSSYKKALREGKAYDIELKAEFPDGKKKELHLLCEPDPKPGPKGYYLRGTIQDITQRKRLENERLENERRFQQLINAAQDLIFIHGFSVSGFPDKFIKVNDAACQLLGYTEEELYQLTPLDIVLERGESDIAEELKELNKHKHHLFEKNLVSKAQKHIPVEISARLYETDQTRYAISIARDITERKQAEEALQESEENYRKLVELAQEGIWVIDKEEKTSFVNPNMAKMLGYTPDEMKGLHIFEFMDDQGKIIAERNIDRRKQGFADQHDFEFIHKNGNRIYTAMATSPLLDKDGNYEGAIAGVLDLTERRKAELERRRLQTRLAQSQKMESIGNLAGGIAHDFNNILASIIGFTELALHDAEKGTELEDCLKEVYAGGNRAKELVKQILAFARQSDEVTKPVQLSSIAREVLKLIRSTIPTSIAIEKQIESSSLVIGNPVQLHQVFLNLFTNASQAMKDQGGILSVEMRDVVIDIGKKWDTLHLDEGEYIEVIVSDTGEGIESDILDQIFEPYFTTKEPGEGSGMGLAVVSGIVESYGGKIIAESIPGERTQFFMYLPITKKLAQQHSYDEVKLPSGKERILFVDDEPPLARMGGRLLERLGYSVETRTSSTEALELFRSKPDEFDLVITDMTMPHMMGDKLAVELQQIRSDIPIILCTGYSAIISEEKAKEIGIKAFTYKPIAKADLANTIREVLDGR